MTKEKKQQIIEINRINPSDTGSADVQVAILTDRIERITEHLKLNRKDFSTRRGLLQMVSDRRGLLDYLARTDNSRYRALIERLKLRK